MRLVVFTDYVYREVDGAIFAERAFALFLAALGGQLEKLTIVGRLTTEEGAARYALPPQTRFVALPHYESAAAGLAVVRSLRGAAAAFWRALDDADAVWLLGPSPHALLFAWLTRARRRALVLGVRQDYPSYVRSRHPSATRLHRISDLLDRRWRGLGRRAPVIAVGSELAAHYAHSPAVLDITVSLISRDDIDAGRRAAAARDYETELRLLSVGRIDVEKNPLLLADVLRALRDGDPRWRLVVCGEGPLEGSLRERADELGVGRWLELRGYVPVHGGLMELYRSSHILLHVSLTEGMPQVLLEAFAAGLPTVATAVGGVPALAGDAAILVPPADASAAVAGVRRVAEDAALRQRLLDGGFARAQAHTLERESGRVVEFIGQWRRARGGPAG